MKKFCFLFLIICGLMVFCLQDCQARQKLNLADLENKKTTEVVGRAPRPR